MPAVWIALIVAAGASAAALYGHYRDLPDWMVGPSAAGRERACERATRPERAGEAASESACRGVRRGEAPRLRVTICRLDGNGCAVLFRTPRARLLGVPNAALGLLLYLVLVIAIVQQWPVRWLLALMTPALAMSVFLAGSLLRNRRECRICWTGHFANAFLFAYFFVRTFSRAIS